VTQLPHSGEKGGEWKNEGKDSASIGKRKEAGVPVEVREKNEEPYHLAKNQKKKRRGERIYGSFFKRESEKKKKKQKISETGPITIQEGEFVQRPKRAKEKKDGKKKKMRAEAEFVKKTETAKSQKRCRRS